MPDNSEKDPNLYRGAPPELVNHPLFGKGTVGLMTAEAPKAPTEGINSNADLEQHLNARGLKFERTKGSYGGPENSYIIHNPTREAMHELGRRAGQESVIYGQDGKHELMYTTGDKQGKAHPSLPLVRYSHEQPDDYYTTVPGHGHVSLHFDFDKLHDTPIKQTMPLAQQLPAQGMTKNELRFALADVLKKALEAAAPKRPKWAGHYPWHETQGHHHNNSGAGILLHEPQFAKLIALAKEEGELKSHPTNDQVAAPGNANYAKYAAPYGKVDPGTPSNLNIYPHTAQSRPLVDKTVADHGYKVYYAGGKHGKPDLANKNYESGHLMVYDPTPGGGVAGDDEDYTHQWRSLHELAHAQTLKPLNEKYGEGRRMGGLGKQRTLREAKRAVEWEHMATIKQRELAKQIGLHISDEDFNREQNVVMHNALHRAATGKFTDPSEEGFQPHAHSVPLSVAHGMLDEHANSMGLADQHSLLKKALTDLFLVVALKKVTSQ
jgi:hypothetical protein